MKKFILTTKQPWKNCTNTSSRSLYKSTTTVRQEKYHWLPCLQHMKWQPPGHLLNKTAPTNKNEYNFPRAMTIMVNIIIWKIAKKWLTFTSATTIWPEPSRSQQDCEQQQRPYQGRSQSKQRHQLDSRSNGRFKHRLHQWKLSHLVWGENSYLTKSIQRNAPSRSANSLRIKSASKRFLRSLPMMQKPSFHSTLLRKTW